MTGPRIITPPEAQEAGRLQAADKPARAAQAATYQDLAHTVATEPERIASAERAAVVKALLDFAAECDERGVSSLPAVQKAYAVEDGAPL